VNDGKARNDGDEGANIREIIHLLAAHLHLVNKIVNDTPGWDLGWHDINNVGAHRDNGRSVPIVCPPNHFPGGGGDKEDNSRFVWCFPGKSSLLVRAILPTS